MYKIAQYAWDKPASYIPALYRRNWISWLALCPSCHKENAVIFVIKCQ